ncbi:MAG: hypothetical protein ACOCUV_02295 [bacterium]
MKRKRAAKINKSKPGGIIIGGHVQGLDIVRSLGNQNIPSIVVDTDISLASKSKYCLASFRCPDYNSKAFLSFIINLAKKYDLKGWVLYPTNDFASYNISKNRNLLKDYFKFTVPPPDVFEVFYNKKTTINLAQKCGVPYPKSWFPESLDDLNVIPVNSSLILRGIEGLNFYKTFGKKVFLINNRNDLLKISKLISSYNYDIKNIMVQERIPFNKNKRGFYFTSFAVEGEIKVFFIWEKLREHPVRHGTSTWCKSIDKPFLFEQSKDFIRESGYTGVSEIEYLYDKYTKQYKIIEVNARTFLQTSLSRRSGVDYANLIYKYVNSIPIDYPDRYNSEQHWLHFWTDVFFGIIGVIKKEYSLRELLHPYFFIRNKEMAVFNRKDFAPFLWETILLPYIAIRR